VASQRIVVAAATLARHVQTARTRSERVSTEVMARAGCRRWLHQDSEQAMSDRPSAANINHTPPLQLARYRVQPFDRF